MIKENTMSSYPSYTPQAPTQTNTLAIVSLISGIVGLFMLPVIGGIVAVVTGHMAKKQIQESLGAQGGGGMATAGLIMGYISLVLWICGCIAWLVLVFGTSLYSY
jgi:hypothetical protein